MLSKIEFLIAILEVSIISAIYNNCINKININIV